MTERVYGGLAAEERVARRRALLLDAGLTCFARDGWDGTTIASLSAEAGLSRRYLYEEFADREALFLAVVDEIADEVQRVVRRTLAEAGATPTPAGDVPTERARLVLAALVDHVVADPRRVRVALVESMATPAFRARRRLLVAGFGQLATRLMASFREDDVAEDRERAAVHGALLTGGLVELLVAWATADTPVPPAAFVDHVTELAAAVARA